MQIQNVRGSYDYLPEEMRIRNYIINTLKEVFEYFGYKSIETSILCYYDMLCDKYDDNNDIVNEIYKLSDQGNRKLGLRYDLTVPFAKFIALNKNKISLPFKRYEINKVFRDGPIKKGRDREFIQCDCDVVGISGQFIEAELMSLYVYAFNKLDIDIYIKYNSRKLMKELLIECGISNDLISSVTTIMDKKDKITDSEFNNLLLEIGLNNNQINNICKYFSYSLDDLNNMDTDNNYLKEGLEEINNLNKYLKTLNIDKYTQFDIYLARGQNYYTGNIFEVYDKSNYITSSIGAGGRYDDMIGNYIDDGNNYPAVGISFGLSTIYEIIKNKNVFNNKSDIDILIISMNANIEGLKLAYDLRRFNYKVDLDYNFKKLKKSMEIANRDNIPYVIILGSDELLNNKFKLKDMVNGYEYEIDINNLDNICQIIKK